MPLGVELTAPPPVPSLVTVSVYGVALNVAVTLVAAASVTTHAPVPLHPPPLHPANVEPVATEGVSVIRLP